MRLTQSFPSLFIAQASHNILLRRHQQYALPILKRTAVLTIGRYQRRWARRLRGFVFTREDAVMVAYGSFGTARTQNLLGVDYLVTTDFGMVTNFNMRFSEIKNRFDAMVAYLPEPYRQATLPQVLTPQTILTQW